VTCAVCSDGMRSGVREAYCVLSIRGGGQDGHEQIMEIRLFRQTSPAQASNSGSWSRKRWGMKTVEHENGGGPSRVGHVEMANG
jgi:hypothetical protein